MTSYTFGLDIVIDLEHDYMSEIVVNLNCINQTLVYSETAGQVDLVQTGFTVYL